MNLFDLKKRYFLVTGASGLLGREHCEAIITHNGIPVALDINKKSLEELKDYLYKKYDLKIPILNASVANLDSLINAKKSLNKKNIFISGIINNAAINPQVNSEGISNNNRLEEYDMKLWDLEIDVGLKGSYLVVRAFYNDLLKNNVGSLIYRVGNHSGNK